MDSFAMLPWRNLEECATVRVWYKRFAMLPWRNLEECYSKSMVQVFMLCCPGAIWKNALQKEYGTSV